MSKDDIRNLPERASIDEHSYICLPEHERSFTQTKLVPAIYTKDEINEMLYGICGAQGKNEDDFQKKLDGVYYPLNDNISWLTTCLDEMRQDIARMQTKRAAEAIALPSIDRNIPTSIDDDPLPILTKSTPDSYAIAELDHIVQEIYETLGASEDRLDKRCIDIYFPWNNTSSLTSQTEAMQQEIAEIQRCIASHPEASTSIDRRNKISIDEATPTERGELVIKVTSDI